jgi:hypothetical protein
MLRQSAGMRNQWYKTQNAETRSLCYKFWLRVSAAAVLCLLTDLAAAAPIDTATLSAQWKPEKSDRWKNFDRHYFTVSGCEAWIAVPEKPLPGNPWIWCMEFPTAFDTRTGAVPLVESGFFYIHIKVGNTYGCPAALEHFAAFHAFIRAKGLAPKGTLIGVSRGGLYAYRFAARNPEKVNCIYGDAPVCDFKSWPGGKGAGKGSPKDWNSLIQLYGFKDETEALAYGGNPVDTLKPLAEAGIPLIHVVGDADDVVPVAENTAVVARRYQELGGVIDVFHKSGCGHHPHGLDDPAPVVALIRKYSGV